MKIVIYHPKNGINYGCSLDLFTFSDYEEIGELEVDGKNLFYNLQNSFNPQYTTLNRRSTSIGDIIHNLENDKFYMFMGNEISELPENWIEPY